MELEAGMWVVVEMLPRPTARSWYWDRLEAKKWKMLYERWNEGPHTIVFCDDPAKFEFSFHELRWREKMQRRRQRYENVGN